MKEPVHVYGKAKKIPGGERFAIVLLLFLFCKHMSFLLKKINKCYFAYL